MAEVVDAEVVREADRRTDPAPLAAEGAAPERGSPLADEEQAIGAVLGEPVEVTLDVDVQEAGQVEGARACGRLRVALDTAPGGQLGRGFGDVTARGAKMTFLRP